MYQTSVVMVLVVYEIRLTKRLTEKTLPTTAITVRLRGDVKIYPFNAGWAPIGARVLYFTHIKRSAPKMSMHAYLVPC